MEAPPHVFKASPTWPHADPFPPESFAPPDTISLLHAAHHVSKPGVHYQQVWGAPLSSDPGVQVCQVSGAEDTGTRMRSCHVKEMHVSEIGTMPALCIYKNIVSGLNGGQVDVMVSLLWAGL